MDVLAFEAVLDELLLYVNGEYEEEENGEEEGNGEEENEEESNEKDEKSQQGNQDEDGEGKEDGSVEGNDGKRYQKNEEDSD